MKSFEEFLRNKHAEQYQGLDDEMPEAFDAWICDLAPDDFIKYGDQFANGAK